MKTITYLWCIGHYRRTYCKILFKKKVRLHHNEMITMIWVKMQQATKKSHRQIVRNVSRSFFILISCDERYQFDIVCILSYASFLHFNCCVIVYKSTIGFFLHSWPLRVLAESWLSAVLPLSLSKTTRFLLWHNTLLRPKPVCNLCCLHYISM